MPKKQSMAGAQPGHDEFLLGLRGGRLFQHVSILV